MDRYYDLVLALIPTALLGLGGVLFFAGLGLQVAVSLSGVAAAALICHALFVNGPGAASGREQTGSTEAGLGPLNAD